MYSRSLFASIILAALAGLSFLTTSVSAHGCLTSINGANGINVPGLGIDESTPRDGSRRRPFQQDTSIIRDREIASGETGPCGRTLLAGNNDVAAQVAALADDALPTADDKGVISMTIHQVNRDGAGPYEASVSADGTGGDFVDAKVLQNVPGNRGSSRAEATDFEVKVQMPAGIKCSGGPNGDACLVRVRNGARAGPFGGCGVFTTGEGAAGNATNTRRDEDAFGADLSKRDVSSDENTSWLKKRIVHSRFVGRALAGKWI